MTTALLPRGSRFGDLRLTGFIGRGGFSDVYEAYDTKGRRLAVKVLRLSGLDVDGQNERVGREREVLSRIDSRGVAKLVSSDLGSHTPWIASEFVDGPTLRESVLRNGAFSAHEAYGLVRRLAEILVDLHAAGIAHRDLTPNNVILGPEGPVIIDFGSARLDLESELTGSLLLAGTHGYAPPEAMRGELVGRSGDIYSLGRIAQFCLSGRDDGNPSLLEGMESLLFDDPSSRSEAAYVAQFLSQFQALPARHFTREVEKLPQRFRPRTLLSVGLISILIATGATGWFLNRTLPVRTMSESELDQFISDEGPSRSREPLRNPYFGDPFVPAGSTLRHIPLGLGEVESSSSDPFIGSRTLAAFSIDDDEEKVGQLTVTAEPAPRWLINEAESLPRSRQIQASDFGLVLTQFGADFERLRTAICVPEKPTHGSYVEKFDVFVLGVSKWCGEEGVEFAFRHLYFVFQPSSQTLYRLYGDPASIGKEDVLRILNSILREPSDGFQSVVDLTEGELIEDLLSSIGYTAAMMGTSYPGLEPQTRFDGRIAVRLPNEATVVPVSFGSSMNIWALTDDESLFLGSSITYPIGSFYTQTDWQIPWLSNTFGIDTVVMIHVQSEVNDVPFLDLFRAEDDKDLLPDPVIETLFAEFDSFTQYFGPIDTSIFGELGEVDGPEDMGPALIAGANWDIHLASHQLFDLDTRKVLVDESDVGAVQFGEIVLPLPPGLAFTSESLGGLTYAARANPYGQRAGVLSADVGTHLMIRNSAVVLPGAKGQVDTPELVGLPDCRTVAEGYRQVGPLVARMIVSGNCIVETVPTGFLTSYDEIEKLAPRLTLTLEVPRTGEYPWLDDLSALEVLAVEMTLGYSQDAYYPALLLEILSIALADMSIDEAVNAFGRPTHDDGLIGSFSDWIESDT